MLTQPTEGEKELGEVQMEGSPGHILCTHRLELKHRPQATTRELNVLEVEEVGEQQLVSTPWSW